MSHELPPWMLDADRAFDPLAFGLAKEPVFARLLPQPSDTHALGQALGASIAHLLQGAALAAMPAALFLGLFGTLGAGKTTFVQALLHALGHRGPVPSPTYTLVQLYDLPPLRLAHLDLYRLEHPEELDSLGYWDLVEAPGQVVCVEWFASIPHAFPPHQDALVLTLDHHEGGGRQAALFATAGLGQRLALATGQRLEDGVR